MVTIYCFIIILVDTLNIIAHIPGFFQASNTMKKVKMLVAQSCPTLYNPMDYSLPLSIEFSRQEYWSVGSHSLLQGIFPTQKLNQGLLHCRQLLYQLSYQGNLIYSKDFGKYWLLGLWLIPLTLPPLLQGASEWPFPRPRFKFLDFFASDPHLRTFHFSELCCWQSCGL